MVEVSGLEVCGCELNVCFYCIAASHYCLVHDVFRYVISVEGTRFASRATVFLLGFGVFV